MTERLYYDNSLLFEFDAAVTAVKTEEPGYLIALDKSAFYPTSGGQPCDTGVIKGEDVTVRVTDVMVDGEGVVWHQVTAPLSVGTKVTGSVDAARRLDHMEQHGGEHMLAGAIWRLLGGVTIGLHTGKDDATIDVTMPDGRTHMTQDEIRMLENDVNGKIRQNAPVKCYFPDDETLKTLPLRKAPTVDSHVRVVQMGDFEYCACGGTHPPFTGMIGMVKILSATPAKGKCRVRFVCGNRAHQLLCNAYEAAKTTGEMLSCTVEQLPRQVENLKKRLAECEHERAELAAKLALGQLQDALKNAVLTPEGEKIVRIHLPQGDRKALVQCAGDLIADEKVIALCAMDGEKGGVQVIFACGKAVRRDVGALMRALHVRGGGKPDFAQGSAESADVLAAAAALLQSK